MLSISGVVSGLGASKQPTARLTASVCRDLLIVVIKPEVRRRIH